jgi:hypothetical protein
MPQAWTATSLFFLTLWDNLAVFSFSLDTQAKDAASAGNELEAADIPAGCLRKALQYLQVLSPAEGFSYPHVKYRYCIGNSLPLSPAFTPRSRSIHPMSACPWAKSSHLALPTPPSCNSGTRHKWHKWPKGPSEGA